MANDDTAQQFIQALRQIEESKNVEPLVQLFDDQAELQSPSRSLTHHGQDGARQFWTDYLSAFDEIHSDFTHVRAGDGFAVLEWRSKGKLPTGEPITYQGVSIVEGKDGRVQRFSTYYDSAAFLPNGAKHSDA